MNIPPPSSVEDLSRWILQFETAQNKTTRSRSQWADQAIIKLKDSAFEGEMSEQRRLRHRAGMLVWPWDRFKLDLRKVVGKVFTLNFETLPIDQLRRV